MRTLRNCTDLYGDRRTLNVELVVALRAALSVALASETHTTHTHAKQKTQKQNRPKRSTKRTVTPVNPGVTVRLVMFKISPFFAHRV